MTVSLILSVAMRNLFLCGVASLFASNASHAGDWPQFRGPAAQGVGEVTKLPDRIGPNSRTAWKTALPPGHSSPILIRDRIVLTAAVGGKRADAGRDKVVDEGGTLQTICLDRKTGKILWRREAPRPRLERYQPTNSPVSPTPVAAGDTIYVFFGDFGLLAYGFDGEERWRMPLGPFNNVNGHGTSPIVAGDLLIILCDQDDDSYLLAVHRRTGKVAWRVDRAEFTRCYTTPTLFEPPGGPPQLIVSGAYELTSYDARTGEKLWWVRGLSWQPKSAPIIHNGIVYAHWWEGGGEAEAPTETPTFDQTLAQYGAQADAERLVIAKVADARVQRGFINADLDNDGLIDRREWDNHRARRESRNRLIAVKPDGRGDVTGTHVVWSMQKFLPNVPTPLIYGGIMYLIKDGGILTALDPANGTILKQGRLTGALDTYYASPVAGAGLVYFQSQTGKSVVVKAGKEWEIVSVEDFGEEIFATPAIADNRVYLRTNAALYCFEAGQ
jgi:outer membrane protein assembly factor BamB